MSKKLIAVDLFCGVGGLTRGLLDEGINVSAGVDCDPYCCFPYEHNNNSTFLPYKVEDLTSDELKTLYPKRGLRLLAGCAPCQPFSNYTQGREATKDPKWSLLYSFADLAIDLRPDFITMENVPDLIKHRIFDNFVRRLKRVGYRITFNSEVKCVEYGVPQERERLVLFASLHGEIELIEPTHTRQNYATVKNAIGGLPPIEAGQAHPDDPIHCSSKLSDINLKRIRASKPGGTWRDWDVELRTGCHRKSSGKTYPSVYGRMEWDKPAPTITTQSYGFGNGRFGHPEQDRAISLREAALLQTFPSEYAFVAPGNEVKVKATGRLIGNAVPVELGRVVAKSILRHIKQL